MSKYSDVFSKQALSQPHVLIQKYASEITINIESVFPGTYTKDILDVINNVGKSKFEIQEKEYGYKTNSYWHDTGEIDANIDYNFGWNFDKYWYEPLGNVFGLPGNQIENLVANVIVNEWGITSKGGYNNDPRAFLWNRHSDDTGTWHDRGGYPRTDNWDFYLSYHAMLVAAAKLIEKMPVIKTRDWYDNEWEEWLSRHILTPNNGKWLSDFRDTLPLKRPIWIAEGKKDAWETDIKDEDFVNCLIAEYNNEPWINVIGGWHEKNNERTETYSISSALVAKETSDSLLRALNACVDPYNYKLPYYNEDRMEIENGIFVLKGWIRENSESLRLDEADPYANNIVYPPYSLGENVVKRLGMISTNDSRQWLNESNEISLICESWSSLKQARSEESDQSGIKLKGSLSFLKSLCVAFDCDVILDVGIHRAINYKYDRERSKYTKPQHKLYIFSADGRLKTTGTDYKLG